jgi:hypothetical protein
MQYSRLITISLTAISAFLLNACSSAEVPVDKGGYYHSGIYFGKQLPDIYKKGINDGCTTAKGYYRKSHTLFNNNQNYHDGWFLGRNRCRKLLITDKSNQEE